MLIPFSIGKYQARDMYAGSRRDMVTIGRSLQATVHLSPAYVCCEEMGLDAVGEFPIIRFGIFDGDTICGAAWIGCNQIGSEMLAEQLRLSGRIYPGYIGDDGGTLWRAEFICEMIDVLLTTKLRTVDGKIFGFDSLSFSCPTRKNDEMLPISEETRTMIMKSDKLVGDMTNEDLLAGTSIFIVRKK